MAETKEGKKSKSNKTFEPKPDEAEVVRQWRSQQFGEILVGSLPTEKVIVQDIDKLADSTASPHDLRKLIKRGCDPETAVRILV